MNIIIYVGLVLSLLFCIYMMSWNKKKQYATAKYSARIAKVYYKGRIVWSLLFIIVLMILLLFI